MSLTLCLFISGLISQIVVSTGNFLLIIFGILALWLGTILLIIYQRNQEKKKYLEILERFLREKDQTHDALKHSEEKYHKLIANMNEGLILTNENNQIVFANSTACNILGQHRENLYGKSFLDFVLAAEDRQNLGLGGENNSGMPHREEVQLGRGSGETIWASLSISYPKNNKEEPSGAILVLSDITDKKIAEEKLHKLTTSLNQKIKQLNCLFDISDITGVPGITFEGILKRTLDIIPYGLKYSHDTWVEIVFQKKRYASKNFRETKWTYTSPIKAKKQKLGYIRVGYLEEKPIIKKDPFHINEKILVKNIAEKLGQIIEVKNMEKALEEAEKKLDELQNQQKQHDKKYQFRKISG